ncbi:MAG: cupin domain-containing protein [Burkholderiaceae bacterium]
MKHVLRSIRFVRPLVFAAGAGFALTSAAVHTGTEKDPTIVAGDAVAWGAAPPSLPSGAQAAVLYGNPGKEGPFVLRLRFPAGFVVPPHRHSKDELVTVISGRFSIIAGEKIDRAAFKPLPAASFVNLPAGTAHYAIAETESVVQITGLGPFDITYANKNDDPRAQ